MPCQLLSLEVCAASDEVCCSAIGIAFSLRPRMLLGLLLLSWPSSWPSRRSAELDAADGIVNMSGLHRDLRQTACRGRCRRVISGNNKRTEERMKGSRIALALRVSWRKPGGS